MYKRILLGGIFCVSVLTNVFSQENGTVDPVAYFPIDSFVYVIQSISINSNDCEFSPVIKDQEMLFVSDRIRPLAIGYSASGERPLTDLYISEKIDSVNFKPAKLFPKPLNTPFDDGPACFSEDKKMAVFSTNSDYHFQLIQADSARKNLQLFQSFFRKNKWTQPTRLPFCKNEFSSTHPFLSKDGTTLYFSSDMNGGYGGMDLYYSKWDEGVWSAPVNLGAEINGPFNEVFPFLTTGNVLYYSSNRIGGYGGLDIYSAELTGTASEGRLLERPLNSASDDFGVFIDSNGESGYLSSDRNKDQKDDILYFRNNYPNIKNCRPYVGPSYCYTFYEESTDEGMLNEGVDLTYEWNLGDGTKIKGLEAKHCFRSPGVYNVELNIVELASGALFYNETSYEFTVEDAEQVYLNCPDTVAANEVVYIGSDKSKIPGSSILNYQWDFGNGDHSSGVAGSYRYQKEGTYNIRLGLEFRNDSSGQKDRMCLEKKVVVMKDSWRKVDNNKYIAPLKKKTIFSTEDADSLNFRVFLGTSETPIPKDANFFKGLTNIKESVRDSLYVYTSGNKSRALDLTGEYARAKENGFSSARVLAYSGDSLLLNIDNLMDVRIYDGIIDLKKNSNKLKEFSSNIYFNAYEDSIQVRYLPTLDFVAEMLKKQPELTISIYAFTDTIGSAEFNEDVFEQARLAISLKRGETIRKYFEKKGLRVPEIKNIPKGEHIPENRDNLSNMNTNALYNRRVTIYVKNKRE